MTRAGFMPRHRPRQLSEQQARTWWLELIADAAVAARGAEAEILGNDDLAGLQHRIGRAPIAPFPIRDASARLTVEAFLAVGQALATAGLPERRTIYGRALASLAEALGALLVADGMERARPWQARLPASERD